MVLFLDGLRSGQSGPGLALMILALAVVVTFVLLEYAFDWPIHWRADDRVPAPATR